MKIRPCFLIFVIMILFMVLALPGCWNKREVQQVSIDTGLGIDMGEMNGKPQFLISALVLQTSTAGSSDSSTMGVQTSSGTAQVVSAYGDTIYDGLRDWNLRSSRQLFLGHTQILVLGDNITPEGLGEIVDFVNRDKDLRSRTLVVAYDGLARDALQAIPEFEALTSLEIKQLISENSPRVSKAKAVNIFQMTYDLITPGRDLVLPWLQLVTPPEKSTPFSQSTGGGETDRGEGEQNQVVQVAGSIVYRGYQWVGSMTEDETQGMLFINNEFQGGVIPLSRSDQKYSIVLKESSSKVIPEHSGGKLIINVNIKGMGHILEAGTDLDEVSPQLMMQLEQMLNQEILDRCNSAILKSQTLQADVFGFGDKIHRVNPRLWKKISGEWTEIYPEIEVNLSTDFAIEHFGPIR